ncbi:MAG: tripartite tricarboxylate transporter TctB family protein [Negativicutes bacterium]|nr:tripartite tricarboxylate transporter TctB family protein [Negativicutes bacterium]
MSELPQAQTAHTPKGKPQKKGELKMLALLFVIFGALFLDSLRLDGAFQGHYSGPGGIPQLVSALMLVLIVVAAVNLLRQGYKEGTFQDIVTFLFDKDVVILLIMVTLYGLLVETLTFIPTSILFLVGTMYLLERKNLIRKIVISVSTVAVLVLIFSTIFQVVLP